MILPSRANTFNCTIISRFSLRVFYLLGCGSNCFPKKSVIPDRTVRTTTVRHFSFIFGSQQVFKAWRLLSHLHFSANAVKHLICLCPPDTVMAIARGDLVAAVVLHSPGTWDFLLQCTHHQQLGFFTLVSSWALVCASHSLKLTGAISNFKSWALDIF